MQNVEEEYDINVSQSNNINVYESKHLPKDILQSIDKIAEIKGYTKFEVDINNSAVDKGVTADLYEVEIKGDTSGKIEISVFIKYIKPCNHITMFSVANAFKKECYFYKELANIFTELQDTAHIPKEERYKIVKSYEFTNSKAIFMDNLIKQGYYTCRRTEVMSLKFAELSVKQLAKFHGLSYALRKIRPEYFENKLRGLKQPFIFNKEWEKWFLSMFNASYAVLDEKSKLKFAEFKNKMLKNFRQYTEDTSSPGCTLCHGDYRHGNILVKETDGLISEVIPLDYQVLNYGCPLNDFMYLIFSGSDQEFRKKYLNSLKNLYYEHLVKFLGYFNLDVSEIYPRHEFERQFKERLDLGLIIAIYCLPFAFSSINDVSYFEENDLPKKNIVTEIGFRERIQGIVNDFIDWGYL